MPFGSRVDHVAIFDHQRAAGKLRNAAQHERRSVGVVPQHRAANTQAVHIQRIVLRAEEAVLDQRIAERVDAVAVRAPGEDLGPPHLVGMAQLVRVDQHQRVICRVGDGDSFHAGVRRAHHLDRSVPFVFVLGNRRFDILGMFQSGSRQRAETEDTNVMAVAPFLIGKRAVHQRVSGM